MKEEFQAFYCPTNQEFEDLWKKCIFSLDANVLLNLYRYSPEACLELIDTLTNLSKANRLWIAHQAALEYHKNRLGVIIKEKSKFKSIPGIIDKHIKALKDELKKDDRTRKNTYAASIISALEPVIDKSSKEIKAELKKHLDSQPDRTVKDDIREVLNELLNGKIGAPYDRKKLEDIYKECDRRYELRIPPGYEDAEEPAKKGRAKYGDAILWFQLIDYAKEKKLPIILITDDDKEDWWNAEKEDNDKQSHYDLIQEFTSTTGCPFYAYPTDRFLYWAKKQIGVKVSDETIEELKQIRVDDEKKDAKNLINFLNQKIIKIDNVTLQKGFKEDSIIHHEYIEPNFVLFVQTAEQAGKKLGQITESPSKPHNKVEKDE